MTTEAKKLPPRTMSARRSQFAAPGASQKVCTRASSPARAAEPPNASRPPCSGSTRCPWRGCGNGTARSSAARPGMTEQATVESITIRALRIADRTRAGLRLLTRFSGRTPMLQPASLTRITRPHAVIARWPAILVSEAGYSCR